MSNPNPALPRFPYDPIPPLRQIHDGGCFYEGRPHQGGCFDRPPQDPPAFVPQVPPRPRAHIEVRPGSRFEQLLTLRRSLIAQFEDAKAKLDTVKIAIRNEMINSAPPGTEVIDLPPGPDWPGLTVVWSRRSRIDIKALRHDHADLCEQYRIPDPRWELREQRVPE